MSAFNAALANHTAPAFNYVVPNMCEDGHDNCKPAGNVLTQFDDFLSREVPLIQQAYPDATVIVTYDEGQGGSPNTGTKFGGGNVLTAITGPDVVPHDYPNLHNHYGLLRTVEDGFGSLREQREDRGSHDGGRLVVNRCRSPSSFPPGAQMGAGRRCWQDPGCWMLLVGVVCLMSPAASPS